MAGKQPKAFRHGSQLWGPQAHLRVADDLRRLLNTYSELHLYVDSETWTMADAQSAVRMMPIGLQELVHLYAVHWSLWPEDLQALP